MIVGANAKAGPTVFTGLTGIGREITGNILKSVQPFTRLSLDQSKAGHGGQVPLLKRSLLPI